MPLTSRPVLRRTTLAAAPLAALGGRPGRLPLADRPTTPHRRRPASTGPAPRRRHRRWPPTAAGRHDPGRGPGRAGCGRAGPDAGARWPTCTLIAPGARRPRSAEAGEASEAAAPQPAPGRSAAALALVLTEERRLAGGAAPRRCRRDAASGTLRRALASHVRGGRAAAHPAGRHRRVERRRERRRTERVEALQTALAGEHAALCVYGVLGGADVAVGDPVAVPRRVTAGYQAHRGRRDQLVRGIRDLGAEPVAAEAAYELPNPVATPRQVEQAALVTEQRCAATYADRWRGRRAVAGRSRSRR